MTWTQRALLWGREERYKIVGATWLLSMVSAFGLVGRNPYLTGPQKLVQARVYAQGLTLAVMIISAAFEVQDSREQRGRYETVEYVDEKDHKTYTKQVERSPPSDGDDSWKDMVKREEERLKERDDAIKSVEDRDRKKRSQERKDHPKKAPTKSEQAKPKEQKKGDQHKDQAEESDKEENPEGEEEEEEGEYKPVPGKKGEGKMMRRVSDPPDPNTSVVP